MKLNSKILIGQVTSKDALNSSIILGRNWERIGLRSERPYKMKTTIVPSKLILKLDELRMRFRIYYRVRLRITWLRSSRKINLQRLRKRKRMAMVMSLCSKNRVIRGIWQIQGIPTSFTTHVQSSQCPVSSKIMMKESFQFCGVIE